MTSAREVPPQDTPESGHKPLSSMQWIAIALGVSLAVTLCIIAGRWQFSRHETREAAIHSVTENYNAAPRDLSELLHSPTAHLQSNQVWAKTTLTGEYKPQFTALLRNRPVNSTPGVHILVPFVTNSGQTLLVNRGWMPQDSNFDRPSTLPAPPAGTVSITVHLRESEPDLKKDAPKGQVQMIFVPAAISAGLEYGQGNPADLPNVFTHVYGSLSSESPAAADFINPPPRPSTDPKNHLSYAFQWWVFAIGAGAGFIVLIVREVRLKKGKVSQSSNPFAQLAELEKTEHSAHRSAAEAKARQLKAAQSEEAYEDSLFE